MATKKTVLLIEVDDKNYHFNYSGGLRPDWSDPVIHKRALKHDG